VRGEAKQVANCYNTDCERVLIRSDKICDCNIAKVCVEFASSPRGKDENNRNGEFTFMVSFAGESCFDEDICRDHFRILWTAYCLHHNLDVDTSSYDSDLRELWEAVSADEEETADWSDFDSFSTFMCRYLV
jgi:hypothetical protein